MMTGLFGQQLGLVEQLAAATWSSRVRVLGTPFYEALYACRLPMESYVGKLRALAVVHGALEPALASSSDPALVALRDEGMRKLSLVEQDLLFFEPRAMPDIDPAADAALALAAEIRRCSLDRPLFLLGCVHVLSGVVDEPLVDKARYARAFLLDARAGLRYLGSGSRQRWTRWCQRLDAVQLDAAQREQVIEGALDCFTGLERVLRGLHPVTVASTRVRATSLNPDAGAHPVPEDPEELQAALRAAERRWAAVPYFAARYGERGRRFGRSDTAWLATLASLAPERIDEQVRWLARVLAVRGMPSMLLAVQIEVLVDELEAARPEKRAVYAGLRAAAAGLHAARRAHLADEVLDELDRSFTAGADAHWCERLPGTGALLACAVVDERVGHVGAASSLATWLGDARRFPEQWIAQVRRTLDDARARVYRRPGETAAS